MSKINQDNVQYLQAVIPNNALVNKGVGCLIPHIDVGDYTLFYQMQVTRNLKYSAEQFAQLISKNYCSRHIKQIEVVFVLSGKKFVCSVVYKTYRITLEVEAYSPENALGKMEVALHIGDIEEVEDE